MADKDLTPENELHEQQPPKGCLGRGIAIICVILSTLFLLNFSAGMLEIPDNLPIIGNIDEVLATGILLSSLQYLGFDILGFFRK